MHQRFRRDLIARTARGAACGLVTIAITLGATSAALARQTTVDLGQATLEELMKVMITSASRTLEGLAGAPALVRVVSAHDIEIRGYRSLIDVLKDLPEFKVDFAGDQDFPTELTVQGTRGTSRIVLLLDGIRVSAPTGEPLPILSNYPVHNARQIEIVLGPSSALYGADAFSAVINIVSKDIGDASGLTVGTSAGQAGLYNQTASYGQRLGARGSLVVATQFLRDAQPDLSRAYPQDFGGLQSQRTGIFNTIFGPMTSSRAVSPRYSVPLAAHSLQATVRLGGWQFALFENRARVSTAPAYTPDNAVYNDSAFNDNRLLVGSGTYVKTLGDVTTTSTVTASRHELSPQSGYWNVYSNLERSYKYAYGSVTKVEEQVSWRVTPDATLTVGATFEHFYAIPQGADLNEPVISRDLPGTILDTTIVDDFVKLRYSNTGAYGQFQYALTPRISMTAGARADRNTRFGATFNPRLGLVATPRKGTTLKLLYGQAYLAPSPFQGYGHFGSFYTTDGGATYASDFWHLGNPDLQPQRKSTVEGTLRQRLGPTVDVSASLFVSRITNLIKESDAELRYAGTFRGWPVAYIEFPVNEGHQLTHGGTLSLDVLKSWSADRRIAARFGLSVADGWVESGEQRLQLGAMVPVQLRAGADAEWGRVTAAVRVTGLGHQRLLATTVVDGTTVRRTLDGYGTVDLNVRLLRLLRNLDGIVTIENLGDARYRNINARAYTNPEELIGAPQNPRRITVGLSLRLR